jgi:Ran GTPase-activating protein (RanGAP) involved in mRNA processing and transport
MEGRRYIILETEVSRQQAGFLRDKLRPILESLGEQLGVAWTEQEMTVPFAKPDASEQPYTGADRELVEAIKQVNGRVVHRDNRVEEVDLSEIKGTDGIVEIVSQLSTVQRLHIKGKGITDEAVRHLTHLTELRVLDLESTSLTDEGVGSLRALEELECLSLKGTRIGSAALRRIADLPALEELDLAYTAIDDQALVYLADCENLDYLDLTGTKVSPGAIEELRQRLPDCSIVTDDDEEEEEEP